jgi:hypothetical protein
MATSGHGSPAYSYLLLHGTPAHNHALSMVGVNFTLPFMNELDWEEGEASHQAKIGDRRGSMTQLEAGMAFGFGGGFSITLLLECGPPPPIRCVQTPSRLGCRLQHSF